MLAIQSFQIGGLCGAGRPPEVAGIHASHSGKKFGRTAILESAWRKRRSR